MKVGSWPVGSDRGWPRKPRSALSHGGNRGKADHAAYHEALRPLRGDFVVDRNVHKQARLVPGVRIPIDDPAMLIRVMPDYVLLLAWNFRDEILSQQDEYRRRGGKFVIPVPEPMVV